MKISDRKFLRDAEKIIKQCCRDTAVDTIEIGNKLIACKALLEKDEWEVWLKNTFGWAVGKATYYTKVALSFSKAKKSSLKNIDGHSLLRLMKVGVPQVAVEEVVMLARTNPANLVPDKVASIIKKHTHVHSYTTQVDAGCMDIAARKRGSATQVEITIQAPKGLSIVIGGNKGTSSVSYLRTMKKGKMITEITDPEFKDIAEVFAKAAK